MTVVAIMQPTYLPWSGYLAMIERADVFVFLDSVQFARRSWQQRNRIKASSGELMLTIPVLKRGRRDQPLKSVEIDPGSRFAEKHIAAIEANYAKAPYFDAFAPQLFEILHKNHGRLCELTVDLIKWLMVCIESKTPIHRSSEMAVTGQKDALLLSICSALDADTYLSAPASRDYLEESECFPGSRVNIAYHRYDHPVYPQLHGSFLPHMSVIDLLFNTGNEAREILMSGVSQ